MVALTKRPREWRKHVNVRSGSLSMTGPRFSFDVCLRGQTFCRGGFTFCGCAHPPRLCGTTPAFSQTCANTENRCTHRCLAHCENTEDTIAAKVAAGASFRKWTRLLFVDVDADFTKSSRTDKSRQHSACQFVRFVYQKDLAIDISFTFRLVNLFILNDIIL